MDILEQLESLDLNKKEAKTFLLELLSIQVRQVTRPGILENQGL